jgi:hypothetical protein
MSVGEFTASNINMDMDKEDEKKKTGIVDMAKRAEEAGMWRAASGARPAAARFALW